MRPMCFRRLRAVASLVFVLAAGNACSFLFSQGPPVGHEKMDSFTCTETDAYWGLDVAWALLNITGALIISADRYSYENANAAIWGGFAWAGVSTASAITGFNRTKKCRAAKAQLTQRQRNTGARPLVQSVALTPQNVTLAIGQTQQMVVQAYHSSGVAIPDIEYTWSSSDDSIASVSGFGLVTAKAPGIVWIAARTPSLRATSRIVVVAAPQ